MTFIIKDFYLNLLTGSTFSLLFFFMIGKYYIDKIRLNILADSDEQKEYKPKPESAVNRLVVLMAILMIFSVGLFLTIPEYTFIKLIKEIIYGLAVSFFLTIAILDLKYGEVYVFELSVTNTFMLFVIPIIVNLLIGCKCISIGLGITFGVYLIIKVLNYIFNKELNVGGADVDCLAALILANIGLFLSFERREENPIFIQTFYFEKIMLVAFVNFTLSLIVYFIMRSIKDKKKRSRTKLNDEENILKEDKNEEKKRKIDFRCLPSFILIYSFTLFFILFY